MERKIRRKEKKESGDHYEKYGGVITEALGTPSIYDGASSNYQLITVRTEPSGRIIKKFSRP